MGGRLRELILIDPFSLCRIYDKNDMTTVKRTIPVPVRKVYSGKATGSEEVWKLVTLAGMGCVRDLC